MEAIDQYGPAILSQHEDARDDLILSACSLDAGFASRIRKALKNKTAGSTSQPVEISSGDDNDNDDDDNDDDNDNDDDDDEDDDVDEEDVESVENDDELDEEDDEDDE